MEFTDVLMSRRSIRAFADTPVSREQVEGLLAKALESPSWSNTQPYKVALAMGAPLEELRQELSQRFARATALQKAPLPKKIAGVLRGGVMPDGDFKPILKYPKDLQPRRVATGIGLYNVLGIARDDHAARDAQMARNFSFFDAPAVLFVFVHEGLGSCAQGALALWRSPVEARFAIDKPYKLLCGLSLGYPLDAPVNRFKPERRTVAEILLPTRGTS
ncbi:MAG: nitroreductase family protein [Alcanivoracaceae bacterium]|jgi:nitroreductase|nr:nitroreductase family protein [Alcanivoracaceae bacterium]